MTSLLIHDNLLLRQRHHHVLIQLHCHGPQFGLPEQRLNVSEGGHYHGPLKLSLAARSHCILRPLVGRAEDENQPYATNIKGR